MDSNPTCLVVISIDSAVKKYEIQYPQEISKEHKYIEKKVIRHISDYLSDFPSSDEICKSITI